MDIRAPAESFRGSGYGIWDFGLILQFQVQGVACLILQDQRGRLGSEFRVSGGPFRQTCTGRTLSAIASSAPHRSPGLRRGFRVFRLGFRILSSHFRFLGSRIGGEASRPAHTRNEGSRFGVKDL